MANLIVAKDALNSSIPVTNIRFKATTELGIFVQNLVEKTLMMMATSLDGNTTEILKEQIVYLLESEQGADMLNNLDKMTMMIAQNLSGAFDELKNGVAPEVDSLQQEITKLAQEYITAGTGIDALTESLKKPNDSFRLIDWNITEIAGPVGEIVGILNKKSNLAGEVSTINVNYIFRKMGVVEDIAIPEEARAKLIGELETKLGTEVSVERATLVLNLLTSSSAYTSYVTNRFASTPLSSLSACCVVNAYDSLKEIYPFVEALKSINPSLIDSDKTKWENNINCLIYLCYGMIYLLHTARLKKMNEVLILDADTLNKDQLSVYESKGGTTTDIANFLRVYYNSNANDIVNAAKTAVPVPPTGVKTTEVLNAKAKVNDVIARAELSIKGTLLVIKESAFKNAYAFVMKNYVKEYVNTLTEVGNKQELQNAFFAQVMATQHLVAKKDTAVEDAVYEFFFRTKYKGTTAEIVYRKLGMEYVRTVSEKGHINDEDINMADAFVMCDIAVEFMTSMMEVVKD